MNSKYSPANVFRFCPRCGNHGFAPENEKSLKCNSCGFRYFINMNAAVAAIIRNDKNEVLFTIRKHDPASGMLDLPGGFVDMGERAEDALAREVYEELNLQISEMQFYGTFSNKYLFEGVEYQTLDMVFSCLVQTFHNLKAADDVSGYVFRDPNVVLPEEIGLASIREIVELLKSQPE